MHFEVILNDQLNILMLLKVDANNYFVELVEYYYMEKIVVMEKGNVWLMIISLENRKIRNQSNDVEKKQLLEIFSIENQMIMINILIKDLNMLIILFIVTKLFIIKKIFSINCVLNNNDLNSYSN